jgi:hypothetical protein
MGNNSTCSFGQREPWVHSCSAHWAAAGAAAGGLQLRGAPVAGAGAARAAAAAAVLAVAGGVRDYSLMKAWAPTAHAAFVLHLVDELHHELGLFASSMAPLTCSLLFGQFSVSAGVGTLEVDILIIGPTPGRLLARVLVMDGQIQPGGLAPPCAMVLVSR